MKVAQAKRAEALPRLAPAVATNAAGAPAGAQGAVEPDLPRIDKTELIADAYSRGQFSMSTGNSADAITAFREVVKLDPTFVDAWSHLAMLYEEQGNHEQALAAFRSAKKVASH